VLAGWWGLIFLSGPSISRFAEFFGWNPNIFVT
jgi:hypothetical protein